MQVKRGDVVRLRDGRLVVVEDAADQDPDAYRLYDEVYYERTGKFKVNDEMPVETIFMGDEVKWLGPNFLSSTGRYVVSDMSEVVSIEQHLVLPLPHEDV